MRKLLAAVALSFLLISQLYSKEAYYPAEIPQSAFVPVIVDPLPFKTETPRAQPEVKQPKPIVVETLVKPRSQTSGIASWYCKAGVSRCTIGHSGGYYAAIRRDLLELRGSRVLVCTLGGKCIKVTIIDCNCGSNANLIDLYWDAFDAISDPSLGRVKVTIKW